ncbi:MAG: hypothetical protein HY902_10865 [Deltaproteobacteria bacterium]|nr:hypothetical protein [Deltaproteobacteria bacterium]
MATSSLRFRLLRWIGSAALVLAASSGAAAGDVESRLAAGEIVLTTRSVAGCDLPEATLQAVIDAPPAKVWKLIDDCNNYSRTMLRIAESKELMRSGTTSQCMTVVDMPMPLSNLTSVSVAESVPGPPTWKRTWKLLRGDYKRNEGSWTLTNYDAEGKRTRVVYRVLADPSVSVPNYIIRKAQESTLPDMLKKIRTLATR